MKEEKLFPITKCPNCGGGTLKIRQRISGYGEYFVNMVTGEVESTELHNGLIYRNVSKWAVCADCGKRLFKVDDDLHVLED